MKRIWNALRYGDSETRKCIGSVILFTVAALVLIVVSGLSSHFELFIVAMIFGIVALVISQTFTLVDDDFVAEIDKQGDKDTVRSVSVIKNGVSSKASSSREKSSKPETSGEEWKTAEKKLEKREEMEKGPEPARFDHYTPQMLKKIQRKYHMKRDHRPIIIDSSASYHIKECPAFIWRTHNKVFLLLLEKEPRKICISREMILHMDYVPNVRADRDKEYLAFQKDNMVTGVFKEFLPDYFDSKAEKANLKYKHLYEIYPDIRISNRSAYEVMDLLYLNFMPQDKITQSDKINGFFKRVYAAHIMFKDRVYKITAYKEDVERILKEMCYVEMPEQEFIITLDNLVKGRMISEEYAEHYIDYREKVRGKPMGKGLGR
ncbi:MAG: hypothetical protein K2K56_10810 [Lachnospiraceae bacterium]|nr:hypothetical protein [Lachnospiraceae bacterium]